MQSSISAAPRQVTFAKTKREWKVAGKNWLVALFTWEKVAKEESKLEVPRKKFSTIHKKGKKQTLDITEFVWASQAFVFVLFYTQ